MAASVMKECDLYRIVHVDQRPECQMYLRERGGRRVFPIVISITEMAEIHRKVHGHSTRRPMTHDLFRALMARSRVELARVEITELKEEIFFAHMQFEGGPDGSFTLDARPSDAVAIATGLGTPIFVSEAILDEIGILEEETGEEEAF